MKKKTVLLILLMLFLPSCGDDSKGVGRLTGNWVCDAEATFDRMDETKVMDEEQRSAGLAVLRNMSLEIDNANKSLTLKVGPVTEKASYAVKERKKNIYTVTMDKDNATIEFKDDNTLYLTSSDEPKRTVVFKRRP